MPRVSTGCTSLDLMCAANESEEAQIDRYLSEFSFKKLPSFSKYVVGAVSRTGGSLKVEGNFGDDFCKATLTIDKRRGTMVVESYEWLGTLPATRTETLKLSSADAKGILAAVMSKVDAQTDAKLHGLQAEVANAKATLQSIRAVVSDGFEPPDLIGPRRGCPRCSLTLSDS